MNKEIQQLIKESKKIAYIDAMKLIVLELQDHEKEPRASASERLNSVYRQIKILKDSL